MFCTGVCLPAPGPGSTENGEGLPRGEGERARIVQAIARDEQAVLSVSCVGDAVPGCPGTAFSLPRVVGAAGVTAELMPELSPDEARALTASATLLARTAAELGAAG